MLFIDHGNPQVGKNNILLKHRMGANQQLDLAVLQCCKFCLSVAAFVAAGQELQDDPGTCGQRLQSFEMLTGQNFGGCHHHALATGLDGDQKRHKRHQRFSRANVAL